MRLMFCPQTFCPYLSYGIHSCDHFHRGRRGQRDKIPICQNWIGLDPEHAVNPIESIETLTEMVDGKDKVHFLFELFLFPENFP